MRHRLLWMSIGIASITSGCHEQPPTATAKAATPPTVAPNVEPNDDYTVVTVDAVDLAKRFRHTSKLNAGIEAARLMIRGPILRHGYRNQALEEIVLGTPRYHVSVLSRWDEAEAARILPVGQMLAVSCESATGPADDVVATDCSGFD